MRLKKRSIPIRVLNSQNKDMRFRPMSRKMKCSILLTFLALIAGGALSIPFVYESQTLWYKTGYDKTLLRAGQLAGLLTALLLLSQLMSGVRGRLLEELFGVAALLRYHRINGLLLFSLACLHMALVMISEEIALLSINSRYWPEMVGILLLFIILTMVVSSLFRNSFGLAYGRWRLMHRLLACLVPLLIAVHVFSVSDSFEQRVPMVGFLAILALQGMTIVQIKWLARRKKERERV